MSNQTAPIRDTHRKYTKEELAMATILQDNGFSINEVAKSFGRNPNTLRRSVGAFKRTLPTYQF